MSAGLPAGTPGLTPIGSFSMAGITPRRLGARVSRAPGPWRTADLGPGNPGADPGRSWFAAEVNARRRSRRTGPTFADLVAEVRAAPAPVARDVGPPPFRDPEGRVLERVASNVSAAAAQSAVVAGARLAWEGCGCGGGWGGCTPTWLDAAARARAVAAGSPRLRGRVHPTWIDLWAPVVPDEVAAGRCPPGDVVVYAHAEVVWGRELW